jgi:hypothetical protein
VWKTTDGGTSWIQISGPFVGPPGADHFCGGALIGALAVSPRNSSDILAGMRRQFERDPFARNAAGDLHADDHGNERRDSA